MTRRVAPRAGARADDAGEREAAATYGALLDAVRDLRWPASAAARSVRPGTHQSRARGSASEVTEYRPYRQGDDVRRLDWRLLARTDRAYLRLSDERSVYGTVVVLDATASMAFPVPGDGKWRTACALGVGLVAVALASGDPAGVALAGTVLPPRTRRGTLAAVVRSLAANRPAGTAPLTPVLRAAACVAPRLVIVSDLLGDEPSLRAAAAELRAGGKELHMLHVVAAEEVDPPRALVLATDPERPDVVRPVDRAARSTYLRDFATWRGEVAVQWRRAGVGYTLVIAGRDAPAQVIRQLVRRVPHGGAPDRRGG